MKKFLTLRIPVWLTILTIVVTLGFIGMKAGALITDYWDIGPWRVDSSGHLKPTGTTQNIGDATNRVAELYVDDIYISKYTSSPKIYVKVQNVSGITLADGYVVVWDTAAPLGVAVETTSTAGDNCIAGVIAETIANGAYGKMQVYGYHSAIKNSTSLETGGAVITQDIVTSTRAYCAGSSSVDNSGIGFWLNTNASSTTCPGFLRAF